MEQIVTKEPNKESQPLNKKLAYLLYAVGEEKDDAKVLIRSTPKMRWKGSENFPRSSQYRGVSKNGSKWQVRRFFKNSDSYAV